MAATTVPLADRPAGRCRATWTGEASEGCRRPRNGQPLRWSVSGRSAVQRAGAVSMDLAIHTGAVPHLNPTQVGRAAEHYVTVEIHRRGGYAACFGGNMPAIDIFITPLADQLHTRPPHRLFGHTGRGVSGDSPHELHAIQEASPVERTHGSLLSQDAAGSGVLRSSPRWWCIRM